MASPKNLVIAGEPSLSLIYTEIDSGSMPPKDPKLSESLIQLMNDWITNGAKND